MYMKTSKRCIVVRMERVIGRMFVRFPFLVAWDGCYLGLELFLGIVCATIFFIFFFQNCGNVQRVVSYHQ